MKAFSHGVGGVHAGCMTRSEIRPDKTNTSVRCMGDWEGRGRVAQGTQAAGDHAW